MDTLAASPNISQLGLQASDLQFPSFRFIYTALEAVRLPLEALGLAVSFSFLKNLPKGDGHPEMVLPPYMAEIASPANCGVVLRAGVMTHMVGASVGIWRTLN